VRGGGGRGRGGGVLEGRGMGNSKQKRSLRTQNSAPKDINYMLLLLCYDFRTLTEEFSEIWEGFNVKQ
jgi:hypothetical protein